MNGDIPKEIADRYKSSGKVLFSYLPLACRRIWGERALHNSYATPPSWIRKRYKEDWGQQNRNRMEERACKTKEEGGKGNMSLVCSDRAPWVSKLRWRGRIFAPKTPAL